MPRLIIELPYDEVNKDDLTGVEDDIKNNIADMLGIENKDAIITTIEDMEGEMAEEEGKPAEGEITGTEIEVSAKPIKKKAGKKLTEELSKLEE